MSNSDFNQLAGSVRALEEAFLCLARMLEMTNTIDGPEFTDKFKNWTDKFRPADPESADHKAQLEAFRGTVRRLTMRLEQARTEM
jgi:hypothetical protein